MFSTRIENLTQDPREFLSNLLVSKKDGGNRPIINLKHFNEFIPYQHFKMEGLHLLKDMLQEGDYMCKIDLKDANPESRKFLRFLWQGNLYVFRCLCFWLGSAPLILTKLMKVPLSSLRHVNNGSVQGRDNSKSRHINLPPTTIGVYKKQKEVETGSNSDHRFLGWMIDSLSVSSTGETTLKVLIFAGF